LGECPANAEKRTAMLLALSALESRFRERKSNAKEEIYHMNCGSIASEIAAGLGATRAAAGLGTG
jgi:hypothetical protein